MGPTVKAERLEMVGSLRTAASVCACGRSSARSAPTACRDVSGSLTGGDLPQGDSCLMIVAYLGVLPL